MLAIGLVLLACAADEGGTTTATTTATHTGGSTTATTPTGSDATTPAEPEVHIITVEELETWLAEGRDFDLVNVHVPYEGEIEGTDANIPYTDIDGIESFLDHDLDRLAVLYCKTGPMSAQATAELVDRGYRAIYDFPEAMVGWQATGHDLVYTQ